MENKEWLESSYNIIKNELSQDKFNIVYSNIEKSGGRDSVILSFIRGYYLIKYIFKANKALGIRKLTQDENEEFKKYINKLLNRDLQDLWENRST